MTIFPFIKTSYITDIKPDEIINRVEHNVVKPDRHFTFQKAVDSHIPEGRTTENGFIVVNNRYGLTYGKTSLLPYLIGRITQTSEKKTKLKITIQPSPGTGLIILGIFYIMAFIAIYIFGEKKQFGNLVVPFLFIGVTYISLIWKFNKEKKTYKDFIENKILRN